MKYDSERDKVLDWMVIAGWAQESCGDVNSPVGHFARISNSKSDGASVRDAFRDDMAACEPPVKFEDLIGHFIVSEDDQGFVAVEKFVTEQQMLNRWNQLYALFDKWNSGEDDSGPCCYGFVTSRGQVHEVDCPEFKKKQAASVIASTKLEGGEPSAMAIDLVEKVIGGDLTGDQAIDILKKEL